MQLKEPTDKLFAFAIYGRDFAMDDGMVSSASKGEVMLALVLVAIFSNIVMLLK
jgi:hypothetical protein